MDLSPIHLLILLLIILILFGRGIFPEAVKTTSAMPASPPTNAAMFPPPPSPRPRRNAEVSSVAQLIGSDHLLSKRFIGAFVIFLYALNPRTFQRMIQSSRNSVDLNSVLGILFFSGVFIVVTAFVLRRRMPLVTSALGVGLIYSVIAYAALQVLFPHPTTLREHFEVRRLIAEFAWPFMWVIVLSLCFNLLRPWWFALMAGLLLDDLLEYFVTGAIYGVGTSYWSLLPSSEEAWSRLALVGVGFFTSALVTTCLFAVLLRLTKASSRKFPASEPQSSRWASA